jgi:hypothetical protein
VQIDQQTINKFRSALAGLPPDEQIGVIEQLTGWHINDVSMPPDDEDEPVEDRRGSTIRRASGSPGTRIHRAGDSRPGSYASLRGLSQTPA